MKKYLVFPIVILAAIAAVADTPAIKVSPDIVDKAKTAQIDLLQTRLEMNSLETQYKADQEKLKKDSQTLDELVKQAFVDAKLDDKKYDVSFQTFEFTPKPAPAEPEKK